ncbi:hypothetical protein Psi02_76320 [Planotetraspora silvatica]|uniref:Site-specific integrase n=1 Tax=Planotetraspora silvatica TaxID=234614 RepID=A0A8J3USD9_9ACTN|nr:site-specific integrase [Planotetraspora silvatica]GII51208.1 hypothetical protein Psi02_76320 [Planotetraspora silvatica]
MPEYQAPETGESKPKWVGGFATEDDAKAARDEARVNSRRGEYVDRNEITVGEYLDMWIEDHAMEIKPGTLEDYRISIRLYIKPYIGNTRLQAVRPSVITKLYRDLLAQGGRGKKPLAVSTVIHTHAILRRAFRDAVLVHEYLSSSPVEKAKRPRTDAKEPGMIWSAGQLRTFLQLARSHRLYAFFHLAAYTGARRGELLNLRWADVDLEGKQVTVKGSTGVVDGEHIAGTTKSGRTRVVTIDERTVTVLREHLAAREVERRRIGDAWKVEDNGHIFTTAWGGPIYPTTVTALPGKLIKAYNEPADKGRTPAELLPYARLHDLRHIHATTLLLAGVPVHVVAARLGHADPAITLRVYAHVIRSAEAAAADMARVLAKGPLGSSERASELEPPKGIEPLTPSLRVKCKPLVDDSPSCSIGRCGLVECDRVRGCCCTHCCTAVTGMPGSLAEDFTREGDDDVAGWSAMGGTHEFFVPDDHHARELAQALAAHGFARVTAWPSPQGVWRVTALDEGPYPVDATGHRMIDAVARAAAAVARKHSGYPQGGSRCDVSMLPALHNADVPIVCTNPGAHPPTPAVVVVAPPPPAPLALTPDTAQDVPIDLSGLDDIPWADLAHAHGSAEDIPELLRALADPFGDWNPTLDELFGDNLLHQGSCYSATAPALPFLTRMIVSGALPARQRLDLYVWLLIAADRWADSLLGDADRAVVQGGLPIPATWTEDVHLVVGDQLSRLLSQWETEPPAVRFVLACLAALYPHHGRRIGDQITHMAQKFHGTQPGAYLLLAEALVHTDDDRALAVATDIIAWETNHDPGWLDAAGVTIPAKAGHVLTDGALRALSTTD